MIRPRQKAQPPPEGALCRQRQDLCQGRKRPSKELQHTDAQPPGADPERQIEALGKAVQENRSSSADKPGQDAQNEGPGHIFHFGAIVPQDPKLRAFDRKDAVQDIAVAAFVENNLPGEWVCPQRLQIDGVVVRTQERIHGIPLCSPQERAVALQDVFDPVFLKETFVHSPIIQRIRSTVGRGRRGRQVLLQGEETRDLHRERRPGTFTGRRNQAPS